MKTATKTTENKTYARLNHFFDVESLPLAEYVPDNVPELHEIMSNTECIYPFTELQAENRQRRMKSYIRSEYRTRSFSVLFLFGFSLLPFLIMFSANYVSRFDLSAETTYRLLNALLVFLYSATVATWTTFLFTAFKMVRIFILAYWFEQSNSAN